MSRALLSNTDKEVIFDGLKKLYRKKVQCGNVGWRRKAVCDRNVRYRLPWRPKRSLFVSVQGLWAWP